MDKKIHQAMHKISKKTSVLAVASCLALSGVAYDAAAAGLGKIAVFSSLGQPLRAEIELTASREELADMRAQLASADSFKQAGIDLAPALQVIRFAVDKRPNGQAVIRLTSERPINDPFVDLLLELNWATGRLVREYTFLLDPPEMASKTAPSPVVAAQSSRQAAPPATVRSAPASAPTPAASSSIDEGVRARARQAPAADEASPQVAPRAEARDAGTREVQRGETLRKIAAETKPEGVALEQMLVGLLRANRDAFDGGNMNRLRAGRILTIPAKSDVEAVTPSEAKKVVAAQSSDWQNYRSKLAGLAEQSPAKEGAARQESGGRITAKVEERAGAQPESKDRLQVSRTETGAVQPGRPGGSGDENLVAKDKALKEANERLALLEKNVADLQKLLEMKNQSLAELQKQSGAKLAEPVKTVEAAKPLEQAKPVEAPKPVETPKPTEAPKPAEVAKPVEPAKPVEAAKPAQAEKPTEAAKPAEVPKPAEPAKADEQQKPVEQAKPAEPAAKPAEAPKPKVAPPPPPPPPEPSFLDSLLDNPMTLFGGGGILALLVGLLVARRKRAAKPEEPPIDLSSTLTPSAAGSLATNSVFRSTGGQSVDTSRTPVQTDFSQAGPGSIDTDEVDPVAEADVYMAYGRDAQAEEILLEAKHKDPKRYAIHLKLLEIYANRKDLQRFETLASELYSETGGVGADWEKAMAIGHKLDPANPLYGGSAQASATQGAVAAALAVSGAAEMRNTVTLPGELAQLAMEATEASQDAEGAATLPKSADELNSLDFDLGQAETPAPQAPVLDVAALSPVASEQEPQNVELGALDFDLAAEPPSAAPPLDATVVRLEMPGENAGASVDAPVEANLPDLDFDLGIESQPQVAGTSELGVESATAQAKGNDDGVEFDVSLTESTFLGRSVPGKNGFDMASLDLELDHAPLEASVPPVASPVIPSAETLSARTPYSSPMAPPEPGPVDAFDPFERDQVSTAVNPDFGTAQAETVVNPGFTGGESFDLAQAETMLAPSFGESGDVVSELDITPNEEVTTKLDLAKAYEEMGDLEGARELLQEVVKEGDVSQREKAQALLARIGE